MTRSPTVAFAWAVSICERIPIRESLVFVTRPASGSSIPAIIFISVLFPEPFRPTIPIRSPSETPSETPSRRGRISKALETSSIFTTLRATVGERTFEL